jgi:anti-sigma factor RsiW
MTECWSEGELRAYLDRELPAETLRQVALHLAECTECGRVAAELERRAGFVSRLMSESEPAAPVKRASHGRRWMAAALAIAAGLAIAAVLIPKRTEPPNPVSEASRTVVEPAGALVRPARRPVRRSPPAARLAAAKDDGFVRLDDEPFETGVIVRVALGPQQVPADVIFGSDGRPRAIRLVNFK